MGVEKPEVVTETGSGMNDKRRKLNRLLADPTVGTLIVDNEVEIGTGGDMGSHAAFPMSPLEACETIWLNKYGKRFCNEGLGGPLMSGCTPARQPGDILYSIWDADWKPMLLNQIAGHLALKYWDDDTINKIDGYMQAAEQAGQRRLR